MQPRISVIAAVGRNRELGKNGDLIWRIPDDLRRVKALTMGHPILMGKTTYESIGKPLPGRTMIVISRDGGDFPGCHVCTTIPDALALAQSLDHEEIFIFGGASIYTAMLPFAERLYLTKIDAEDPAADAFFPDYASFSKMVAEEHHTIEHAGEQLEYSFVTLER